LNWFDEGRAISETAQLSSETDAVLVHLHWGADADAFIPMPSIQQRRVARALVDAGANVVVGCHTHVLQGHERWRDGYIFYGMGNFLFWPSRGLLEVPGPYPRYVREVGVASCRVRRGGVSDGSLHYLLQKGLSLHWDDASRRRRTDRRLSHRLTLSDIAFARARRLEEFYAKARFRLHAVRLAGGMWPWISARYRRLTLSGGRATS
jgi:hypothetical protein